MYISMPAGVHLSVPRQPFRAEGLNLVIVITDFLGGKAACITLAPKCMLRFL